MGKDKKLPGSKTQPKYFGPYKVEKVTKGHVIATDHIKKSKKVPFHLTKKYLQRISKVQFAYTQLKTYFHNSKHLLDKISQFK